MRDFFIRGRVLAALLKTDPETKKTACPTTDDTTYQPITEVGLRVEVWDKDFRFDDRLDSSKTDSQGFFEIRFTDEDFQQDYLDLDWEPEIFFRVYHGKQLLFSTETEKHDQIEIPWNQDNLLLLRIGAVPVDATCYVIEVTKATEIERPKIPPRQPQDFQEAKVDIVDILPTSDQTPRSSQPTSSLSSFEGRGGSLQQILDGAFSEVLGRNLKVDDAKALRESLTQTFTAKQTNGRTDYVWTPRTYSTVQTDLGGTVSGAQASLYHRAKAAGNDALRLLDQLYPLEQAADPQNAEAMRSIVRTEIMELIEEMGATGGPRVQRVDSLFQLLLGDMNDSDTFQKVGGQLKNLADVFGLVRSRINTVDEEQNYSNYLIIKDYLASLKGSWNAYNQDSGGGAFVGTQLVLLSQGLSVVAESVEEVYRIMELVFLGPAERQAVLIDFTTARDRNLTNLINNSKEIAFLLPDRTPYYVEETSQLVPPMSVEGLLTWALHFGRDEGPALARAGGKLGIANAIAGTAKRLMILAQAAAYADVRNNAFRREGVRRSLRDLASQLYQIKRLAEEIIPPPSPYAPDDLEGMGYGYGLTRQ